MTFSTRRDFLRSAGVSLVAAPSLIKSLAQGKLPHSDKLTLACIGVGSQGMRVMLDFLRLDEVQVVAVCDVNQGSSNYLEWGPDELRKKVRMVLQDPSYGSGWKGPTAGREIAQQIVNTFYARERKQASYSGCHAYEDFRELLAKEKDLDAVVVSTPDHWHAIISIAAMRAGKHVYSQKPMAHSVWEAREMERVASETKRATQVSIFNSATPAAEQVSRVLQSGVLGEIKQIDIWTSRASSFWRQGLPTPKQADEIPQGMNWDMWLGPAPLRPYSKLYEPFAWRAWFDFGCGALGDMGEYGIDTITRAMHLGIPERIESSASERFPDCFPVASSIHFQYPAAAGRGAQQMNWFDGGIKPQRPKELPKSVPFSTGEEGVMYTGEKAKLLTAFMGDSPRVLTAKGEITLPVPQATESEGPFLPSRPELGAAATAAVAEHYLEWIHACHGGPPARANYSFERPIVEGLMLGVISVRAQETLEWDATGYRFTQGSSAATSLLKPQFRAPWKI